MSEETKYITLWTKNAKMMLLHGDKLTKSEWARSLRTNGLHTEIQHSDRYGGISQSCTMSDGCNGHRFKMISYSHPYRWSKLRIAVTAEQEAVLFKKGCELADMDEIVAMGILMSDDCCQQGSQAIIQGPNHIKYDKGAAFFSFISKRNIYKPSKTKMICNRACAVVMLEVWPDMLITDRDFKGEVYEPPIADFDRADPAQLTPDELEYMARYYFDKE